VCTAEQNKLFGTLSSGSLDFIHWL